MMILFFCLKKLACSIPFLRHKYRGNAVMVTGNKQVLLQRLRNYATQQAKK